MNIRTALAYASGLFAGGLVGEIWNEHFHPERSPELGFEGALIGLLLFALLFAVVIYAYGWISGCVRQDAEPGSGYIISAIVGLPFWYVLLPLHKILKGQLNLPDGVWWFESVLLCIVSFEIIRFVDRFWSTRKNAS